LINLKNNKTNDYATILQRFVLGVGRRSGCNFNFNAIMKKKKKKIKKLTYDFDKLYRWNLCQQLASVVYDSPASIEDIIYEIDKLKEKFKINKK